MRVAPLTMSCDPRIAGPCSAPSTGRSVVVEGDRIVALIPDGRHPAGPTVLDLEGLTLLPGLINCHVHFCLGGEPDPAKVLAEDPPATRVLKAALRARQTVEAGVTTVRDLGGVDGIALAIRDT